MLQERAYTNSLGMRFARIEAGRFVMGGDHHALGMDLAVYKHRMNGDYDEHPRHRVTISRPFYLGVYEVTNLQYEAFDPAHRALRGKLGFSNDDDEAVVFVSWYEAAAFAAWLAAKEGLPYRLPSEAEWEYACRAGGLDFFHTGPTLPPAFLKNARESWYPDPSGSGSADIVPLHVGKTEPNPWGLYDMHGNVEEWCTDWYGPYPAGEQVDPAGYEDGDFKVTRGGSHSTELYYLRSANRMATLPDDASWLIGLRVAIGEAPAGRLLPRPQPPRVQTGVQQVAPSGLAEGHDPAVPFFAGPIPYVKVPIGSFGPLFSEHNHVPSIAECPNGDLLAVWFTCWRERGREMALAASRLPYGEQEWQAASPFWDAPDRNMTQPLLWKDGKTIHLFVGLATASTWGSMAICRRSSSDSGATWSRADLIIPDHAIGQILPNQPPFWAQDGRLVLPCDDGNTWTSMMYVSGDGGATFQPQPGRIAGIHAPIVQLGDGHLLAFGRYKNGDPRPMPRSESADMGETWTVTDSTFDPIFGGQRPAMIRLREGPLFFASFARRLMVMDAAGTERAVSGLFGALSYDEGASWPVRRLITVDGPAQWVDGDAWTGRFVMSHTYAEPKGYLFAIQTRNGLIHLISSMNHYRFNRAWLEALPPPALGDGLV